MLQSMGSPTVRHDLVTEQQPSRNQKPGREKGRRIKKRSMVFSGQVPEASASPEGNSRLSFPHMCQSLVKVQINAQELLSFRDCRQSGSRNSWGISKESSLWAFRLKSPIETWKRQ